MAELLEHQQRVVDEHAELRGRLAKPHAFIGSDQGGLISATEKRHQTSQAFHMTGYMLALEARMELWGVKVKQP